MSASAASYHYGDTTAEKVSSIHSMPETYTSPSYYTLARDFLTNKDLHSTKKEADNQSIAEARLIKFIRMGYLEQAETLFKAFGRALRAAVAPDPRMGTVIPSTKGSL